MPAPNRILIIKPSSLGDVATTLPLLCDLHAAFPQARIDWLIHPALAALVDGHDAVHEVIPFDRKKLASWWYRPSAFSLFIGLLRKLRRNRYDLVIDAQGLFRSAFLAWITGAKRRIGFANAREGASATYTDKVRLPESGKRMVSVDRMRALAGPLGVDVSSRAQFRMPIAAAALRGTAAMLSDAGIAEDGAFVAVIPGARWNTKRWDLERYTEVARKLMGAGQKVVLLGSPDEKVLCDRIQQAVPAARDRGAGLGVLANFAGVTGLAEVIAILSRAALVIGNDSGPLHVAVALGRPTLSIYGPTSPEFVGPYGQLENVLRHDVPCHPCRRRECDHHSCMKGVTVELVWERAAKMLPSEEQPRVSA